MTLSHRLAAEVAWALSYSRWNGDVAYREQYLLSGGTGKATAVKYACNPSDLKFKVKGRPELCLSVWEVVQFL